MISRAGTTIPAADPGFRRTAAFTLIELILVMALLIIVIAAVAPSLSRFFHARNLDTEARRLLALTHYGQSRAVSEGVPMRLWVDANRRTYGLQGEYGGATQEGAVQIYQLDPELGIEVFRDDRARSTATTSRHTTTGTTLDGSSLAVGIRFLADGTLDESSPDRIRIFQDPTRRPAANNARRGDDEVWITTDTYRLRYEIATNLPIAVRR